MAPGLVGRSFEWAGGQAGCEVCIPSNEDAEEVVLGVAEVVAFPMLMVLSAGMCWLLAWVTAVICR
jgi:hypothetical protein